MLRRVRLRRLWNVAEQFHLAATAQNLKRLVCHLAQKESPELSFFFFFFSSVYGRVWISPPNYTHSDSRTGLNVPDARTHTMCSVMIRKYRYLWIRERELFG